MTYPNTEIAGKLFHKTDHHLSKIITRLRQKCLFYLFQEDLSEHEKRGEIIYRTKYHSSKNMYEIAEKFSIWESILGIMDL